jgi:hypothetical protein
MLSTAMGAGNSGLVIKLKHTLAAQTAEHLPDLARPDHALRHAPGMLALPLLVL